MSIRCGSCKDRHDSVSQVLSCSAITAGRETCKHSLDAGTCVTCARWNKRRGATTIRSHLAHPPAWLEEGDGICSLCHEIIWWNDQISVRRGFRNWAHTACFADPGAALEQPGFKSQREAGPEYNSDYDKLVTLLNRSADLLPEAITVEQETTVLLLKQVAEDMEYDLFIDLIRETIYGYSLEMLGAFEPKDKTDYLDADEDLTVWYDQAAQMWAEAGTALA